MTPPFWLSDSTLSGFSATVCFVVMLTTVVFTVFPSCGWYVRCSGASAPTRTADKRRGAVTPAPRPSAPASQ